MNIMIDKETGGIRNMYNKSFSCAIIYYLNQIASRHDIFDFLIINEKRKKYKLVI